MFIACLGTKNQGIMYLKIGYKCESGNNLYFCRHLSVAIFYHTRKYPCVVLFWFHLIFQYNVPNKDIRASMQ